MGNRDQYRAEVRSFKRDAAHGLLTYLIEANDPLDRAPVLGDAINFWRANAPTRKPICIGCKAAFTGEARVDVAAFLLATSPTSSGNERSRIAPNVGTVCRMTSLNARHCGC